MTKILAIDIAEQTGVATFLVDINAIKVGSFKCSLAEFYRYLQLTIEPGMVVVYEDAFAQPGQANARFHERVGVLKAICEKRKIKPVGIPVLTWRRWFLNTHSFLPKPLYPKELRQLKRTKPQTKEIKLQIKILQKQHDANKRTFNKAFKKHTHELAEIETKTKFTDDNASDAYWVLQCYRDGEHNGE